MSAWSTLDKTTHDEYACTFAALILFDEGADITADKIKKLVEASGNKIENYWAPLFAKALQGRKITDLLASGGAPAGGAAPTTAAAGTAAKAETKAEAPAAKPKEEEPEVALGGGLFGDDDDY